MTVAAQTVEVRKRMRALSRAISAVENRSEGHEQILAAVYRAEPSIRVIGVTGPPGAGKSTLVDVLAEHWGNRGENVAVLAVDPSSPYSGGAVLGDRIRMDRCADLPGVYLRSVSARGEGGGLSAAVCDILAVLNEAGFDRALLETVGAGQSDVAVADMAECTVVVGVPGLGDHVQASKAGMMEVGDVYALNKSDLPGADTALAQVEVALSVAYGSSGLETASQAGRFSPGRAALLARHGHPSSEGGGWRPPAHAVAASVGSGVVELAASIDAFLRWCETSGRIAVRRRARFKAQLVRELGAVLLRPYLIESGEAAIRLATWVDRIAAGEVSPREGAERLVS